MLRRFRQIDAWEAQKLAWLACGSSKRKGIVGPKTEGLCKARAPWRTPCALRPNVYERKSCHDDTRNQQNLISGHAD